MTTATGHGKRSRGRPPMLRLEAIVTAAIATLDELGAHGFSMRAVADRLGVGKMSLYHHVADSHELQQLVIERLLTEIPLPDPDLPWAERLTELACGIRALVNRHPSAALLLARRQYHDPAALRPLEALLAAIHEAGLRDAALAAGCRLVFGYATGFANLDLASPLDPPGEHTDKPPLANVSEVDYPHVTAAARALRSYSLDEQFRIGLQPLITGLVSYAARRGE